MHQHNITRLNLAVLLLPRLDMAAAEKPIGAYSLCRNGSRPANHPLQRDISDARTAGNKVERSIEVCPSVLTHVYGGAQAPYLPLVTSNYLLCFYGVVLVWDRWQVPTALFPQPFFGSPYRDLCTR